jgi:16S rRNA (cytosine967-C5)-methyltransferase
VAETVNAVNALERPWAKGLVNAVLRRAQRERDQSAAVLSEAAQWSHPGWLLQRLQSAWPEEWQAICAANNQAAPMTLRINRRRAARDAYQEMLAARDSVAEFTAYSPDGLRLERPLPVTALPGFSDGWVSVQDEAAQLAALLLAPQPGERVLDACAAPGGKTAHLLEVQPELDGLLALDQSAERLVRCSDTLRRLGLRADCQVGDAAQPEHWWDGRPFDRILIDAPCSATGVIRRHPDIKLLRRPDDIDRLRAQQQDILEALWPLLRPGGRLLYATCSVLPEENTQQVRDFLQRHPDARERAIAAPWGRPQQAGRQILPGEAGMDGFYFACVEKA